LPGGVPRGSTSPTAAMWKLAAAAGAGAASTALYWRWSVQSSRPLPRPHGPGEGGRTAVVVGATGATGRQVVRELLASDRWSRVTAISRRPQDLGEGLGPQEQAKLQQEVLSFSEQDAEALQQLCQGRTALFICLGTTRAAAGSPAAFKEVEVGFTKFAAEAARKAGVEHALVVSAQGADASAWVPSERIHPLLYVRTLGEKEQAVLEQGFPRTSVFRPGVLNRLTSDRPSERLLNYVGLGLRVDTLARCMVRAAESVQERTDEPPAFYEGNNLLRRCGSFDAAPPAK